MLRRVATSSQTSCAQYCKQCAKCCVKYCRVYQRQVERVARNKAILLCQGLMVTLIVAVVAKIDFRLNQYST